MTKEQVKKIVFGSFFQKKNVSDKKEKEKEIIVPLIPHWNNDSGCHAGSC